MVSGYEARPVVPGPGRLRQDSPPQLSHLEDTVLGFRVHRMLPVEFLQVAWVMVYDYYEPCEQGTGDGSESGRGRPAKGRAKREGRGAGQGRRSRAWLRGAWASGKGVGQEGCRKEPKWFGDRGRGLHGWSAWWVSWKSLGRSLERTGQNWAWPAGNEVDRGGVLMGGAC